MHAKFIAFLLHKTYIRHAARLSCLVRRTQGARERRESVHWGADESSWLVIASVDLLFSTQGDHFPLAN